jgi:hypothetical protein
MKQSNLIVDGDDETRGYTALLKLRRGAASGSSWGFNSADVGAIISVGASSECDWQVGAPGVRPLSLLFTGKALLVRSDDLAEEESLHSALLWPGWVPLEQGDLIELGASCIEVTRVPAKPAQDATSDAEKSVPDAQEATTDGSAVDPGLHTAALRLRQPASRGQPRNAVSDEAPPQPAHAPGARTQGGCSVASDTEREVWATVLEEPSPKPGHFCFLPYTLFFVLAYAGWVVVLERM